jgi:hypothetical protein
MLSFISLDKNFATTLVLVSRRLVLYQRSTRTHRRIAPLDKATNEATITGLTLEEGSITTLTVDITELKL